MSRTYRRRDYVERDCNCGAPIRPRFTYNKGKINESVQEEINISRRNGVLPNRICDCDRNYRSYIKRNYKRDRKDHFKPNKIYKKVMKKIRKAKIRHAMAKQDYDNIPISHKENDWLWN